MGRCATCRWRWRHWTIHRPLRNAHRCHHRIHGDVVGISRLQPDEGQHHRVLHDLGGAAHLWGSIHLARVCAPDCRALRQSAAPAGPCPPGGTKKRPGAIARLPGSFCYLAALAHSQNAFSSPSRPHWQGIQALAAVKPQGSRAGCPRHPSVRRTLPVPRRLPEG